MKVLLIDDHALFRDAVEVLISHRFQGIEVRHAASLAEADAVLAGDAGLTLALLDLALPDSDGPAGIVRLRERWPQLAVVVVSADERPDTVLAAIDAGAASFIPKTAQKAVLEDALRTVFDGGVYAPGPRRASAAAIELSPRQRDVLRLLIGGKANKAICRELGLSESTVKTHLEAIFRKLDVESRTQAVLAASRLDLRLGR